MIGRRGFLASLLAAPVIGRPKPPGADPERTVCALGGLVDDGTVVGRMYYGRMWYTVNDGPHVYYSEIHEPE